MNVLRTSNDEPVAAMRVAGDRGAALVLALGVMVAMSVILAALLALLTTGFRSSIALERVRNAEYAADGALEQTINMLQRDPSARGMVGTGCGTQPTLNYTINATAVQVTCTGEPIAVVLTQSTPTNSQTGIVLQRNVVLSACAFAGPCTADNATIVAKVNFPTAADGSPTGAFVQSWSVTG